MYSLVYCFCVMGSMMIQAALAFEHPEHLGAA
jgi:hypothetical protein